MHTFTGALMGLAWHAAFVERRGGRTVALFLLCVSIHGAWNALAIGSGLLSIGQPSTGGFSGSAPPVVVLLGTALLALAGGVAVAFAVVTRRVRYSPPPFQASPRILPLGPAEPPVQLEEPAPEESRPADAGT